ncbi:MULTISPECIES: YggT family protein [Oceanobacillus]|uniref:YggT family protein n=1 Tax=Oceanobacillus TaxID=182709 RepID=UPI00111582C6|nr:MULTISPECIES: YggT family protein [Oceanobacillus]MCT1904215.1 YggT family protein [Oceanobacillus sojae]
MAQIVSIISLALSIYSFALIAYILMSWFPGARESQFGEMLGKICEPYLEIFRKFIPPLGMIDFSPIVAILLLQFARQGFMQFAMMF